MMRFTPPLAPAHWGAATHLPDESGGQPGAAVGVPTTFVWRGPRRGAGRRVGDAGLSLLAALGVVCLVAAAASLAWGITPLVVRSGSMEPGLPVGSIALARSVPAADVRPGEVVSVVRPDGTRVTHRVVDAGAAAGSVRTLTLQGDANAAPDRDPVTVSEVDRVVLSVPRVGGLLQLLGRPSTNFAAGLATGIALLWAFGPPTARRLGGWVPEERSPAAGGAAS